VKEKGVVSKKLVLAGVIGLVLILGLLAWAAIAGLGWLWRQAPQWLESGRGAATEVVRRADEALPGMKEKIEQVVPPLAEQAEKWLPGEAPPARDVGGEDVPGVPRFPGLMRAAYALEGNRRTVTYRGEADYAEVAAFYPRELAALGFKRTVLSATAVEEVREYRKADRRLHLTIQHRGGRLGGGYTEVVVAEIGP
jgi:hypothetical protein